MSSYPEPIERPVYPTAPDALKAMSTEALAEHYVHLDEIKLAGETRVGRHPSGRMFVEAMEHDARVREVLDAGLTLIVRKMAAVHARRVADPLDRWVAGGLAADQQKLKSEACMLLTLGSEQRKIAIATFLPDKEALDQKG